MKDGTIIDGNLGGPKEDAEYYYVAEYKKAPKKVLKADVIERKEKYNSFQQSILDGLQLAYKITANSLYGQVGAPTSPIYFKELASSTTATGRKLLKMARDITETNFPGRVAFMETRTLCLLRLTSIGRRCWASNWRASRL